MFASSLKTAVNAIAITSLTFGFAQPILAAQHSLGQSGRLTSWQTPAPLQLDVSKWNLIGDAADQETEGDRRVTIEQVGYRNTVDVEQMSPVGLVTLQQHGYDNSTSILQNGPAKNDVNVIQNGSFNTTNVAQTGYGPNALSAEQIGFGNNLTIYQLNSSLLPNHAGITQNGNENVVKASQSGGDSKLILSQNGSRNMMLIDQRDGNNLIDWTQTGNDLSRIAITQSGGASVVINQSGQGR